MSVIGPLLLCIPIYSFIDPDQLLQGLLDEKMHLEKCQLEGRQNLSHLIQNHLIEQEVYFKARKHDIFYIQV